MPYETWAGGNISGQEPASSPSPHGAYIPLSQIPNAPQTVQMPMMEYTKMPSIRYDTVNDKVDMESRGQKMMQQDLPSSFGEAVNLRTQFAGQGQMAMGKAISSVGKEVGDALGHVGLVMGRLASKANEAKGAADEVRYNQLQEQTSAKLQNMWDTQPREKWPELTKQIMTDFSKGTQGLGVSEYGVNNVQAKSRGFQEMVGVQTINEGNKKEINASNELGIAMVNDGRASKNWKQANEGVDLLRKTGAYDEKRADLEYKKNQFGQGVQQVEEAQMNPDTAMGLAADAQRVLEGKPAETHTILNGNKGLATSALYSANQAVKKFRNEEQQALKEGVSNGEIKTEADIDRLAPHLPKNERLAFKALWHKETQPYVAAEHSRILGRITKFDANEDNVPGHEGEIQRDIYLDIQQNIDKDHRSTFEERLRQRETDSQKPQMPVEMAARAAVKNLEEQDKLGLIGDPAMRTDLAAFRARADAREAEVKKLKDKWDEGGGKTGEDLAKAIKKIHDKPEYQFTPAESAAYNDNGRKMLEAQTHIEQYKKEHPNADPKELGDAVFGPDSAISKDIQKNAGQAATRPSVVPFSQTRAVTTADMSVVRDYSANMYRGPVPSSGVFGGVLTGKESMFIQAAGKYGIDPTLLMAISMHETGNGTSDAVKYNNPGGIMNPATNWSTPIKFRTLAEGIDAMAKNLRENYVDKGLTTIEQIQGKYAPDKAANDPQGKNKDWVPGVTKFQNEIRAKGGSVTSAGTSTGGNPPTSAGPIAINNAVDPTLPAMNRQRTTPITKIVVHGDVLTDVGRLISVQKADDKGYHYYIGMDGSIRMVVPPDHIAYHIKGANSDSIGIVIAGADNGRMPNAAQERSAKLLISTLGRQYGISPQNVQGHGERQPNRRDVREGGHVASDIRAGGYV